jgi:Nuclease-related domain
MMSTEHGTTSADRGPAPAEGAVDETTVTAASHPPAVQDYRQPDKPGPDGQTYGAMISDLLLQRWRQRAAMGGIVAVALWLLIDFRVGVSAGVLVVIADTLWRARSNRAQASGPKLNPAMRRTERQLRGFERKGYQVLHSRSIPDTPNRIDHLIIGPTGVYVIDSEKWDRKLAVRSMSHRKLFHGPFDMHERLDEARFEARKASRLISAELGTKIKVQPSLAIYGPSVPWRVLNVRDVDVYSGGTARAYLRRRPKVLSPTEIERITRAALKVLPPM